MLHGADRCLTSSAEDKNKWFYTSCPPLAFMSYTGIALPFCIIHPDWLMHERKHSTCYIQ